MRTAPFRAIRRRSPPFRAALVAAAALAIVVACSSSGSTAAPTMAESMAPAASAAASLDAGASPAAGGMTVQGAWARETIPGTTETAVYLTITNGTGSDDSLVGASSPVGMAGVHEVVPVGSVDPMSSQAPMMGMQPVAKVAIPAGGTLELKPGSYHIMITGLAQALKAGDTVEVTLTFEKAPPVTVKAEVRAA
jgi:copper(I)-binding protein